MKEFQRNLNAIVIHNSNADLGSNSNINSNILILKVIVIHVELCYHKTCIVNHVLIIIILTL